MLFWAMILISCLSISVGHAFDVLPSTPPIPKDNPQTPAKIELGKKLYFDPRLSRTGAVSCNSCHAVNYDGSDGMTVSTGVEGKKGTRRSLTVFNAAFMSVQFWDGRAATLEEQAKGPLTNPVEMGMPSHDAVMARLRKIPSYVTEFKQVFPHDKEAVTIDNAVKAIAAFERTLITPNSAHDRFMGGDKKAMSAAAQRGMKLVEEVGCVTCHMGSNFAGPDGLDPGLGFYQKFPTYVGSEFEKKYDLASDLGRFAATKAEEDKHMWRVPTWRNVALLAPYFHNGSVKTLPEAVRVMGKTQLNLDLKPKQVDDIVAFLNSLTGEFPTVTMPRLPAAENRSVVLED